MSKLDELSMFCCFICGKYKAMTPEYHRLVMIKNLMVPKDVCTDCVKDITEGKPPTLAETKGTDKPVESM